MLCLLYWLFRDSQHSPNYWQCLLSLCGSERARGRERKARARVGALSPIGLAWFAGPESISDNRAGIQLKQNRIQWCSGRAGYLPWRHHEDRTTGQSHSSSCSIWTCKCTQDHYTLLRSLTRQTGSSTITRCQGSSRERLHRVKSKSSLLGRKSSHGLFSYPGRLF